MIQQLTRSKHFVSLFLLPSVLCLGFVSAVQGQTTPQSPIRVQNADWNISGNQILITYDLVVPEEGEYDVQVVFLNESDKNFHLTPKTVVGDIGEVRGPAKGKVIRWDYTKDLHPNLRGPGYYFGFEVAETGGTSTFAVLLVIVGLAGVLALMFSGESD